MSGKRQALFSISKNEELQVLAKFVVLYYAAEIIQDYAVTIPTQTKTGESLAKETGGEG